MAAARRRHSGCHRLPIRCQNVARRLPRCRHLPPGCCQARPPIPGRRLRQASEWKGKHHRRCVPGGKTGGSRRLAGPAGGRAPGPVEPVPVARRRGTPGAAAAPGGATGPRSATGRENLRTRLFSGTESAPDLSYSRNPLQASFQSVNGSRQSSAGPVQSRPGRPAVLIAAAGSILIPSDRSCSRRAA